MISNNNIFLGELISISDTGLFVATFAQIKSALINQYKSIYGSDIDVDDSTADGVFINTNALIINNILQTVSSMYSNLDIKSATGKHLDVLCALSNIERKPATRSNVNLQVTYLGKSKISYTPDQLTFVDKSGVEWAPLQNCTFEPDETKIVYVECKKLGPISAPKEWIYQIIDASIPILVAQNEIANLGQEEESDFHLRMRQTSSGSGAGITTVSSLESSLLAIAGIQDVKIINNNSNESQTVDDETVVPTHSIYVILRQQPGVNIDDSQIGKLIYSKLTSGICTCQSSSSTGIQKSYEYQTSIANISTSILERQFVYWKVCTGFAPEIAITIRTYETFSTDEFEHIAKYLMEYLNSLKIGQSVTQNDLLLKSISADPKYKGVATYFVANVSIEKFSNPLEFYNYDSYKFDETGTSTYTLTLKRGE